MALRSAGGDGLVKQCEAVIRENIDNAQFSLGSLSKMLGMTPQTLRRHGGEELIFLPFLEIIERHDDEILAGDPCHIGGRRQEAYVFLAGARLECGCHGIIALLGAV